MPFPSIAPGCWFEVPNSKIQSVLPSPLPPGTGGAASIINAWSGGCYDSTRDELVVTGGGHGDYAGNEHYRFNFSTTLAWRRLGPTPNAQIPPVTQAGQETYADGHPSSRHSYGGMVYLQSVDKVLINSGSLWGGSGGFGRKSWYIDENWNYQERAETTFYPFGTIPYLSFDPVTGHVFAHKYNKLGEYDPATNAWTQRGSWDAGGTPAATACIDPVRRHFYLIGGNQVRRYNLTGTGVSNKIQTIATTGPQTIVVAAYPGVEWDAASDRILGWSGGANVYSLDTVTAVWRSIAPSPANTVIPTAPPSQGTHGRWRYVSAHDCYCIVNSIGQNVYIYRPERGVSVPSAVNNLAVTIH